MTKPIRRGEVDEILDDLVGKFGGNLTHAARYLNEKYPSEFESVENARKMLSYRRAVRLKLSSSGQGDTPGFDKRIPDGFGIARVSQSYDKHGEPGLGWVIATPEAGIQREIVESMISAMSEDLPRYAPIDAPKHCIESLCNLYILTDCHLGMMASENEAGESWGLAKGERVIGDSFSSLIAGSPKAKKCVIAELGDFIHSEGLASITTKSKHPLDQDARLGDVVDAAIRLLRRVVNEALASHEEVELVIAEGNHDESVSLIMKAFFKVIYENEPRLKVLDGIRRDLPYYETTHGETMLGFHHGHIKNIRSNGAAQSLALRFASGDAWRKTERRYIHTGHLHNESMIEVEGAKCYGHPSLIAPDAYASRNFGNSYREMSATFYHEKRGKVGSLTVTPEMVED